MQPTDTAAQCHAETLEARAAAILSDDIQGWIHAGDIHWVPNEVLHWFADFMKQNAQAEARKGGILLPSETLHRYRSLHSKAVAELSARGVWGVKN